MMALETLDYPHPPHPLTEYTGQTYYGIPVLKQSDYGGKTAAAFFIQGIGSSSQIIATVADLLDREKYIKLIRTGRVLALLASPAGPMVLIAALHTPRRWYNMLRIFRPTSPMSIGIWALTTMGAFNSLSLAGTILEDKGYEVYGREMDRVFGSFAAAAGAVVSIYMGTELEETSTPVWIGSFPFMPPLFAATGFSNGIAALSLASSFNEDSDKTRMRLQQIGAACTGLQLVFTGLMSRRLYISAGASSVHHRAMAVIWPSILAPSILRVLNVSFQQRALSTAADVATLVGGFLILASLVYAGKESGRIPEDYFRLTTTRSLPEAALENRSIRTEEMSGAKAALWGAVALAAGSLAFMVSDAHHLGGREDMGTDNRNTFEHTSESSSGDPRSGDGEYRKPFDEVVEPLKEAVQSIVRVVTSETQSILSDGKDKVAEQLTSLTQVLRQTGSSLREQDQQPVAQLAETGAEQVERLSGYLREKNLDDLAGSVKDFARRRPAVFIGGALAAGFLLGQLFRRPGRSRTDEQKDPES